MTTHIQWSDVKFREVGTEAWLPAQVPGSVHTDLLALGRIPDPFVADNELRVQWVPERDWEYRLTFDAPSELLNAEHAFLICAGLDTFADVTLNGVQLGHTENAFRQYRWDVTDNLRSQGNVLHILFSSTIAYISERQATFPLRGVGQAIPGGPYARKAPCQFGWDWGPQLPPVGIWKPIRLEAAATARLDDVHLRQRHEDGVAVSATVTLERWRAADLRVVMQIKAPDGQITTTDVELQGEDSRGTVECLIADPQLWWPNGYGEQPLYQVTVALYEGQTLRDERTFQLGLRTIELRQVPDEFGTSFTFVVNGVPVFAKGANWIPADSFPTRISDEHLDYLIRSAADVHMNMLRVWGGGFYEEERFYDLCDRYGILVWQDFTFACSIYPDDEAFVDNVKVEAVQAIRRLRHRASLALWCGNNEMEGGWSNWGWYQNTPEADRYRDGYDRMYHRLLPDLCAAEDPDTPYWPSSPSSNVPFEDPNGVHAGDTHNWAVWHGNEPFAGYRKHNSRFVSEFGFQSLPPLKTVGSYAQPSEWNMTSYIMEHHQRNDAGNAKIINYLAAHFRMPKDFPSLIYLTQILQAEAVRTGVEYWRRNRRCTSGTLYWQLNDCWPVASWASLDYYGRWKALHYAARRFYAPVLLSAEEDGPRVALYVTSDLTEAWQGQVRWSLEYLDGNVIVSGETPVTVPAVEAVTACELDFSEHLDRVNRRQVVLVYELWPRDAHHEVPASALTLGIVPFVPSKHLMLVDPALQTAITETESGFEIAVTSKQLARFVWLDLDGADIVFSDNYFDLPAGRTRRIVLPRVDGWTEERLRAALNVSSLRDTF